MDQQLILGLTVLITFILIVRAVVAGFSTKLNRYRLELRLKHLTPLAAFSGNCNSLLFSRYIIRVSEAANAEDFTRANLLLDRLERRVRA
ncbi:TMhelix containing protein [Vibrio phage vB_VneS_J26]